MSPVSAGGARGSIPSEVIVCARGRRYGGAMPDHATVGTLLREWRTRRRLSQLDLASDAGISARHLSFVETGRARPSREMVLHLAEHLDVPLRARNALLIAAGYAPTYHATDLDAPEMQTVRVAIERILEGHEPFPAILVDRRWELVAANNAAAILIDGVKPELLDPPCNVLRASLHPDGLGSRIANLAEWAEHIIGGLRRQIAVTGDDELRALEDELTGYVAEQGAPVPPPAESAGAIAIPLRLRTPEGELAFITTIATFGTALDVTLAELAIEAFLPADAATANALFAKYG
jgi:transcriptional regulator with XRE-family HTH domain